jgi:hypothetical protein
VQRGFAIGLEDAADMHYNESLYLTEPEGGNECKGMTWDNKIKRTGNEILLGTREQA